jgi:hypothetical protein
MAASRAVLGTVRELADPLYPDRYSWTARFRITHSLTTKETTMAKEKDDVTPEVTNQQAAGTHRPGFNTQVTDAPDYNPNSAPSSQRVQEEQSAGRAALRDLGRPPAAVGITNPADRDPAHAAEVAIAMNAEHEEHDRREADRRFLPEGETDPGEVPSRGYPYEPIAGEENTQGTAAYKTTDPRLSDPDTDLGKRAEGLKMAREAEEARVREVAERGERGQRDSKEQTDYKEKMAQQRDQQGKTKK